MPTPSETTTYFIKTRAGELELPYAHTPDQLEDCITQSTIYAPLATDFVALAVFDYQTQLNSLNFTEAVREQAETHPAFSGDVEDIINRPDILDPDSDDSAFRFAYEVSPSANFWTPHTGDDDLLIFIAPAETGFDIDNNSRTVELVHYAAGFVAAKGTIVRAILGSGVDPRYRTDTDRDPFIEISENDFGKYLRLYADFDDVLV